MSALTQSGRGAASPRPMNVEQIVREAQNFDYNPHVPLKYWFRSASTLLKEVCSSFSIFRELLALDATLLTCSGSPLLPTGRNLRT